MHIAATTMSSSKAPGQDLEMQARTALSAALAFALMWGIGAGSASAAALYTSAAHTTKVTAGSVVSATATSPGIRLTSGPATINNCASSTLNLSVLLNTGGTVTFAVNSGSFATCSLPTTFTGSWRLSVTSFSTVVGTKTVFHNVTLNDLAADFASGLLHGNLTADLAVSEATGSGAGICLDLAAAGTLTHPLTTAGKLDGHYCFTGTGANWSMG